MLELLQKILYLLLRLFGRIENHTKPPELDGGAPADKVKKLPPPEANLEPGVVKLPSWSPEWLGSTKPVAPTPEPAKATVPAPKPVLLTEPAPFPPPAPALTPEPAKETPWSVATEILERPFKSVVKDIPTRRYPLKDATGKILAHGVYSVYGRAPDETGNKDYPKATLKVHEKLPGKWNSGKPRLYMEASVGEHFREGLKRAEEMEKRVSLLRDAQYDVLSYMTTIGAYSFRHIRHNTENDLSYHSWAIAFDQNAGLNRGVTLNKTWQKRSGDKWVACPPHQAQRGPVNTILPFSKQYYEIFPKSLPYELVFCFKSVFFAWGGDWGRSKWHNVVGKFGPGYDQNDPTVANSDFFKAAMKEWSSMTYYDGMHFELVLRGDWAKAHFERMKKKVG